MSNLIKKNIQTNFVVFLYAQNDILKILNQKLIDHIKI